MLTRKMINRKKNKVYKQLVIALEDKVREIQRDNERCVYRINKVKKLMRKRNRDVALLKQRLDRYNDNWRSVPMVMSNPKRKLEQKRGPKPKPKDPNAPPKVTKPRAKKAKKDAAAAPMPMETQQVDQQQQQAFDQLFAQPVGYTFPAANLMNTSLLPPQNLLNTSPLSPQHLLHTSPLPPQHLLSSLPLPHQQQQQQKVKQKPGRKPATPAKRKAPEFLQMQQELEQRLQQLASQPNITN